MKQLNYVVYKHYEKKCYTNNVVKIKKWKIDKRDKEKKENMKKPIDCAWRYSINPLMMVSMSLVH